MIRKNYDIILINLIALITGLALYYLLGEKVEILGAIIATGISLSLGFRHYKTENDKLFKELFIEFNSKYDSKFNDKLEDIVEEYALNKEYRLKKEQKKLIVDYLNFCAEEYLWERKNRIPKEVWTSWENGMVYYLNNPLIKEIAIKEKSQEGSYYGLFEKIKFN